MMQKVSEMFRKYPAAFIGSGVVLILLFVLFLVNNGVTNKGNKLQNSMVALYKETTNELSNCTKKTVQSAGGAVAAVKGMDKIMSDAIRGRYELGSTAQPGGTGTLFSAITEAYPDVDGVRKIYQDVLITINGCQDDFKNSQTRLNAKVNEFNDWASGSWTVRTFGGEYPSSGLRIQVAGAFVSGQEALDQIGEIVSTKEAQTARDTGEQENSNPFAGS